MVESISHITIIVKDLERTANFLRDVFDAQEVYSSGEKMFSVSREKFFLIGGLWIAAMEGSPLAERTYNHIAFKIREENFDEYASKAKAAGADVLPERQRMAGEGRSLYFYDFDNHLFELHTGTLSERLNCYLNA